MMKTADLLTSIEEAVAKIGITLEYDDLKKGVVNSLGGYFTHEGKQRILVHKRLTPEERVDVIIGIISDLEGLDFTTLELSEDIIESILQEKAKRDKLRLKALEASESIENSEDSFDSSSQGADSPLLSEENQN